MRVSVVINTYNRAHSLATTLDGLRRQTHSDFEVVVVNGPSTDGTDQLLQEWSDKVRIERCPERVLGKSRNVGIRAAAGDVVAFIDDDSVPEPDWLEGLVSGYDGPRVGGVGGVVYDRTGRRLQYRYTLCSRSGVHVLDAEPPFDANQRPGADPFIYIQGTNCSFRRHCLEEIGGFDEQITSVYDEVDVCARLIDLGYLIKPLDRGAVHHKLGSSHMRNERGLYTDPYPINRDRAYFACKHATQLSRSDLARLLVVDVWGTQELADILLDRGEITAGEREAMVRRADQGIADGMGLQQNRQENSIGPPNPASFKPFPTLRPDGERLCMAFVSGEYPPGYFGGIGRFTQDLAAGVAALGHDVHVVAPSTGGYSVDLEDGVWVHRLKIQSRDVPQLRGSHLHQNWMNISALYHEVLGISEQRPVSIVSAPLWNSEALLPCLDGQFPTAVTLTTTFRTIAGIHPSWDSSPNVHKRLELEGFAARASTYRHAISKAILADVESEYGPLSGCSRVIPLGVRDRRRVPRHEDGHRLNLLFVGRLERRKGVDLLLEAVPDLLAEFPDLYVTLVGADTVHTELGEGYRERFVRENELSPQILSRVEFRGQVDEESLFRAYAECDVFCAPSRFESLGLVLIEAMMMGKPVVAAKVGGMEEIVEDNGLLVEPEDSFALKSALRTLLGDRVLRLSMGARSRELFENKWSIARAAERTVTGYREFMDLHVASREPQTRGRLTEVLAEIEGLSPEDADRAAAALLDRSAYPLDRAAAIRSVWNEPDEEFLKALYEVFLDRPADVRGLYLQLQTLRSGKSRMEMVRDFAFSEEATRRGLDHSWVRELESLEMPRSPSPLRTGTLGRARWRAGRLVQALRNLANLEVLLDNANLRMLRRIEGRLEAERSKSVGKLQEQITEISEALARLEDLMSSLAARADSIERTLKRSEERPGVPSHLD